MLREGFCQDAQNTVIMITKSLGQIEKLDKANCLLYKSRIESYLLQDGCEPFKRLLELYPSFIDGYLEYWKFLKFQLTRLQKAGMQSVLCQDNEGNYLLPKMKEIVEMALYFSDCTQVPTSLWVEARICFAKQLIYEKDVDKAISVLRDICSIIPPLAIAGLCFSAI